MQYVAIIIKKEVMSFGESHKQDVGEVLMYIVLSKTQRLFKNKQQSRQLMLKKFRYLCTYSFLSCIQNTLFRDYRNSLDTHGVPIDQSTVYLIGGPLRVILELQLDFRQRDITRSVLLRVNSVGPVNHQVKEVPLLKRLI